MSDIKPRPSLESTITSYSKVLELPFKIDRIEIYRTPDEVRHTLAISGGKLYELFTKDHPKHSPLFGAVK